MPLGIDGARVMSNSRERRRERQKERERGERKGEGGKEEGRERGREGGRKREEGREMGEIEREIQLHVDITSYKIAEAMTPVQKSTALPRIINHKRRITRLHLTDD